MQKVAKNTDILLFLWKWKLGTTLHIAKRFFDAHSPHAAYNRLRILRSKGLVTRQYGDLNHETCFWMLTPKGFGEVKQLLPKLKDDGYRSETMRHDFLCAAFQLGDWLKDEPESVELFSEQQLRRLDPSNYPDWVLRTELHRPDGYSRVLINDDWETIAFEVELTHKHDSDYEILAKFYDRQDSIFRVLWLVESVSSAHYIQKRLTKSVADKCAIHDFVSLKDFSEHGWLAPILLGLEAGKTISFLLDSGPRTRREHVLAGFLVNAGKTPYRSASYPFSEKNQKRDRLGPNPSLSLSQNSPLSTSISPAFSNIPAGSKQKTPSSILPFQNSFPLTPKQGGN